MSLTDPIDQDVKIYSTIGLSSYPNMIEMQDGAYENVPVELMMAAYKRFDKAANILSTTGFSISQDGSACSPKSIYKRMVEMYYQELDMKHIYFTQPFLWQEKLDQFELESKKVHFLFCIPISDKEFEYKMENGGAALESLFQDAEIDLYDLGRKSVV